MMNDLSPIRSSGDPDVDLTQAIDHQTPLTIEAWVRLAPTDRAVRLYPRPDYEGPAIRLKAGLHRDLTQDPLPILGSLRLPDRMEVVIFSQPDFKGDSLALRHDASSVMWGGKACGSLAVIDRDSRRQDCAILFSEPDFKGSAQVLELPRTWRPTDDWAGSAWVPPGVALMVGKTEALKGDQSQLPLDTTRVTASLGESSAKGEDKDEPPVVLFEEPNYGGAQQTLHLSHTWPLPKTAAEAKDLRTRKTDKRLAKVGSARVAGNALLVVEQQKTLTGDQSANQAPPWRGATRISALRANATTQPGENGKSVVRSVGILTREASGAGLTIERRPCELKGAPDELHFGGRLLRADTWYHLAVVCDGSTVHRYLNGQPVEPGTVGGPVEAGSTDQWLFGDGLRGRVARLRAWPEVRTPEQIKSGRFAAVADGKPIVDFFCCWRWSPVGKGTDGSVQALAVDNAGSLYAGGQFIHASGVENTYNIAKWDGHQWFPLGTGVDNQVRALALDSKGNLYAGGAFTLTGWDHISRVHGIAVWDGRQWSAVGDRVHGDVFALAFDAAGDLYAAARSGGAGQDSTSQTISKWDGQQWRILEPGVDGDVNALICDKAGNLYVGGAFNHIGGIEIQGLAKWDGSKWSHLGAGIHGTVEALALDALGDLYAGGRFTVVGSKDPIIGIAKWDGKKWTALGRGVGGDVYAVAVDAAGDLYVGGTFNHAEGVTARGIAKWNGWCWSMLDNRDHRSVLALAVDAADRLFLGGEFSTEKGADFDNIVSCSNDVPATLPAAPEETPLYRQMRQKVEAEQHQNLLAARHKAADQVALAHEQAQHRKARARDRVRRDVHLKGIDQMAFVRGEHLLAYAATSPPGAIAFKPNYEHLYTDARGYRKMVAVAWGVPDQTTKKRTVYAADAGWNSRIWAYRDASDKDWGAFSMPAVQPRVCALTCDDSGQHPSARKDGKVRTALYWITEDGVFHHGWDAGGDQAPEAHRLSQQALPIGRSEFWELCIDKDRQALIWSNGHELFRGMLDLVDQSVTSSVSEMCADTILEHVDIIVPHSASPYPIGVAAAPDGSVVWLDGQDEVLRMLPYDKDKKTFGEPKTLYSAPNPSRGLAVCRLADDQKPDMETAFVYWVSGERRTIEVPILDTPGRYIDLYYDPQHPHGQHVAVLPVEQMLGLPADAKAGALWQADGDLGYLHFTADGLNGIAFDSPRLDLSRGLTVEASLILDAQSIDGKPICVYELSTFEDEDRIVCAITPGGLPVLHLRWDGKSRTADSATLPKCELTDGKQHRVTWTLSGSGNVATWIDGNIVHYEQTDWSAGVRVFEGHRLGTPQPAQTHSDIEGATMYRSDPRQTFADFTGRLYRFAAWNNYLPDADGGGEERPGPDPTWERRDGGKSPALSASRPSRPQGAAGNLVSSRHGRRPQHRDDVGTRPRRAYALPCRNGSGRSPCRPTQTGCARWGEDKTGDCP